MTVRKSRFGNFECGLKRGRGYGGPGLEGRDVYSRILHTVELKNFFADKLILGPSATIAETVETTCKGLNQVVSAGS